MYDPDKAKNYELAQKLISQENFAAALIAGAVAMLVAAIAYGLAVKAWPYSYGFSAAGVGIVIGIFMGFLGRGISMKFSVAAAVYTIFGCVLGNLSVKILSLTQSSATSPVDVLQGNSLLELGRLSVSGLSATHLVFWFVAVVAAGFLAKRPLSRAQRLALGLNESRG